MQLGRALFSRYIHRAIPSAVTGPVTLSFQRRCATSVTSHCSFSNSKFKRDKAAPEPSLGTQNKIQGTGTTTKGCSLGIQRTATTATTTSKNPVPEPTWQQLKLQMFISGVPMVGFGFMDNLVMIQAGELIDLTIGVTFGLSTLTAAALGQVVSDVSGVFCGGTLEALLSKIGLPVTNLTTEQRSLKKTKLCNTIGMALGVVIGCVLGMTSLFFIDTEKAERLKREPELGTMLVSVLEEAPKLLSAEGYRLFLVNKETGEYYSTSHVPSDTRPTIPERGGVCAHVFKTKQIVVVQDAYALEDYHRSFGYKIKNMLCGPVVDDNGEVIAILQILNKKHGEWTEQDKDILRLQAAHVKIFLQHFGSDVFHNK